MLETFAVHNVCELRQLPREARFDGLLAALVGHVYTAIFYAFLQAGNRTSAALRVLRIPRAWADAVLARRLWER